MYRTIRVVSRPLAQPPHLTAISEEFVTAEDEPVVPNLNKLVKPGIVLNLACKHTFTKKIIAITIINWDTKVTHEYIRICSIRVDLPIPN
jgi:hypothetical protein